MTQATNPYLPLTEYVPDGEPRLFGDRVYVYGSHDSAGAPFFCLNDYVCWSAPVDDLGSWRYEGVIYRRRLDPASMSGLRLLFAPDCVQGPDGRYYLFYGLDFSGILGVAVCDTPAGEYEYLGRICWPDGTAYGRRDGDAFGFDPGVLVDDDGRVWLYSGFAMPVRRLLTGGRRLRQEGCYLLELERDMHTIRGEQRLVLPKEGPGNWEGHEFFEASSIRKFDGTYYLVYSSRVNHELCYATAPSPAGPWEFGGVLVSLGDVGLDGITKEGRARNYLGNTHGGLLRLGEGEDGRLFVFYHRQTNRTSYSRQACAEELHRDAGGRLMQAQVTSCGLNGGPLAGTGTYPAAIACNLWAAGHATGRYDVRESRQMLADHPHVTQEGRDDEASAYQYVANLRDGSVVGFKWFDLQGLSRVGVEARGRGSGSLVVSVDEDFARTVATIDLAGLARREWRRFSATATAPDGVHALYLRLDGEGPIDLRSIDLI